MINAALAVFAVLSVALGYVLQKLVAGTLGPGRHRAHKISIRVAVAVICLWEITVGLFLLAEHAVASSVGPLAIGLLGLVILAVHRRIRRVLP